jgi:O-antigen chain-terminating methyltransferase
MLETANPEIDVDALMLRLRNRVSELRQQGHQELLPGDAVTLRNNVFINSLEAFANIADQKSQVRTQWPSHLGGPIFRTLRVRKALLDGLAFIFKDQRHVNQALVAAFRESISLNRQLIEQIESLRREHDALKKVVSGRQAELVDEHR